MALPNTGITTSMVASAIGAATNDVGQLCIHPNVNEWSPYKPISSGAITLNEAFREQVSGFLIIGRYLSYNKPTGGVNSLFRIGDFRGYEHNSRKPQNTSITSNVMALNEGDTHGPSNASISISVTLPDTDTFKKIMSEYQVTHCSIYDQSDAHIGTQRMSLSAISETNFILFGSVTLDLSSVSVGATFNRDLKIYYGNSTDHRMFQVPGGDTLSVSGKILPRGVKVATGILPTDSFVPYSITEVDYTASYNNGTGVFTMTYLKIVGAGKNSGDTYKNSIMYNNFSSKINWMLRYSVTDANNNVKVAETDVPNWSSLNAYIDKHPTGTSDLGIWRIVNGTTLTLSNMAHGDTVTFRLVYTALNW